MLVIVRSQQIPYIKNSRNKNNKENKKDYENCKNFDHQPSVGGNGLKITDNLAVGQFNVCMTLFNIAVYPVWKTRDHLYTSHDWNEIWNEVLNILKHRSKFTLWQTCIQLASGSENKPEKKSLKSQHNAWKVNLSHFTN